MATGMLRATTNSAKSFEPRNPKSRGCPSKARGAALFLRAKAAPFPIRTIQAANRTEFTSALRRTVVPHFPSVLPSRNRGVFALQISTLPLTLPLPFNFNLYLTFLQDNSRIREDNLLIYASFSDILIKGKCFPLLYLKVMLMDISYKKIMEATHVRGDTLGFSN